MQLGSLILGVILTEPEGRLWTIYSLCLRQTSIIAAILECFASPRGKVATSMQATRDTARARRHAMRHDTNQLPILIRRLSLLNNIASGCSHRNCECKQNANLLAPRRRDGGVCHRGRASLRPFTLDKFNRQLGTKFTIHSHKQTQLPYRGIWWPNLKMSSD